MRASLVFAALPILLLGVSVGPKTNVRLFDRDPVFSPDGKTVAFVRFGATQSIMLIDADGRHLRTLVPNVDASGLEWSPDGTSLVYSAGALNTSDIWRVDVASGAPIKLTNDGQDEDRQPSWSQDGTLIAYDKFEDERCFRCTGIWVMNADGTNQHEVAQDDGRGPMFSPSSANDIALSSDQGIVIDLSGATIVPNHGPVGGSFTTWSPHGKDVAYMLNGLWVENISTLRPRRVSKLIDGNLSWSPDGRVFAAGYNLRVALLRAKDGSHFRVLPNSKIYGGIPSWSKETVAYVHSGYCGIDLAREDGTRIRRLTRTC